MWKKRKSGVRNLLNQPRRSISQKNVQSFVFSPQNKPPKSSPEQISNNKWSRRWFIWKFYQIKVFKPSWSSIMIRRDRYWTAEYKLRLSSSQYEVQLKIWEFDWKELWMIGCKTVFELFSSTIDTVLVYSHSQPNRWVETNKCL